MNAPRAGARVLVVDDVPEICQMFEGLWGRIRAPGELVTEVNAERAVERLRREDFDLVISDYRMREADGVEVLKAARARNPGGHRILMTGYNEVPTTLARIREAGVDAYVQKPLRAQETALLLLGFLRHDEAAIAAHRAEAREIERYGTVAESKA